MSSETNKKSCLHLVVKSSSGALEDCRSKFEKGDSVLFLDDGVMHVFAKENESLHLPATACYFSEIDLAARALSGFTHESGVQPVSDEEGAALVLAHELCLTWK